MVKNICRTDIYLLLIMLLISLPVVSQDIRYTTMWFGVNANPVPTLQEAMVADNIKLSSSLFFTTSNDDKTQSLYLDIEIPVISKAVSLRIYGCILEHYSVSYNLALLRGMDKGKMSGFEGGDFYLQTRIRLLSEKGLWQPNIVLHSTLKTASADKVSTRRYFDTPGYFFHLESGKDLISNIKGSDFRLRLVLMTGFMCWETSGSLQNDAYMYGLQLIASAKGLSICSELSGYSGWIGKRYGSDYGDKPIVSRFSLRYNLFESVQIRVGYEHGLRHFPHNQIYTGFKWVIPYKIKWD